MQNGSDGDLVQTWPVSHALIGTSTIDTRTASRVAAGPHLAMAAGVGLFVLVWLLHLNSTSLVPPVDDLEQLTWVRSLEWGYYKHPPLPTWLLWLPVRAFGWSAWAVYVVGASASVGSLLLMFT